MSIDIHSLGHAGVMLQARQLGRELYVGVHSDEEITENKGNPVMDMKERYLFSSLLLMSISLS